MGRKIPTCFCHSYLEANIISPMINWLDPDGKYHGCPWLITGAFWIAMYSHIDFMCGGIKKNKNKKNKNILISSTDAERERESKFVCLDRKTNITVFLLQSASAKR